METFMKEFQHLKIQLDEIKSATNDFDDKKVIGAGGFGKVYGGEISHFKGRSMVAFKRLDRSFGQGDPEFWKEIMMLSRYTHANLISLLGFCDEGGEKILAYEHASNGSLDHHISSTSFTWIQRLKICLDAARGLCYLHDDKGTQQRVLHRDIKSSNILLDGYWNAKVSDMGLSKIGPANQQHTLLFTNAVGTTGYVDPIYMKLGVLTKESDVYSFGVVLFEVLCGRLCLESKNGSIQCLVPMWKQKYKEKKLDDIVLRDLMQEMDPRSLEAFSNIAYQCLLESREARPTMSIVVEKLHSALNFQEICEGIEHLLDYEKIIKTAVHPLTYKSEEDLKSHLSKGILLNRGKTWFSLNKNGEHCEMISAMECLIPVVDKYWYASEDVSRFPPGNCYITRTGIFKAHVRTQFLSPEITYTVNLVFRRPGEVCATNKPCYIGIRYRLEGETEGSVSHMADGREDGWWMAELFQFESERRNFDLEIHFEGNTHPSCFYAIEGIEFQPIEKVEDELLEDDSVDMQTISESDDTYWGKHLPNDYNDIIKWSKYEEKWTTKKELYFILCKGFIISNDQWFSLAKNGKRCLMISARSALLEKLCQWKYQTESRFEEVAWNLLKPFSIDCKINSEILSPETTYACYLVYKIPENMSNAYKCPLQVTEENFNDSWEGVNDDGYYIYLVNPQTPVIRPKAHQNSHNPSNRPKLKGIPRQRNDGWMEVQVWQFQTGTTIETKFMRICLASIAYFAFVGIHVQGVEFRPE